MKVSILILSLIALSFGNTALSFNAPEPTDSTAKVVDATVAAYMVEDGKTMYQEGKIKMALIKFRQAAIKNPYSWRANFWIGKCHYKMDNFGYAMKYLTQARELGEDKITDEIYYELGKCHHRLGNIDSAIVNYTKATEVLKKSRVKELRINDNIKECNFAQENFKDTILSSKSRLSGIINSGYDEYGVIPTADSNVIYITSRRSNTTGGQMNPDDQRFFEDIYKCTYDVDFQEWEISNDLGKINSAGFDALNYLSPDTLTAIITLNLTATEEKKSTKGSDICEVKLNKNGKWNSPKIIDNKTINTSFFEGSASLTADGNTMYFVTDRKGGKSSTDIYFVEKIGNSWGDAKPMPKNINTVGRETTPYISPDGKYLFFSSNGHTGMGGLDIFVSVNLGYGEWSDPINLGGSINTVNNDTHFVYLADRKMAFISAVHIVGEKTSLDIYKLELPKFEIPTK